jgi:plastocyanin
MTKLEVTLLVVVLSVLGMTSAGALTDVEVGTFSATFTPDSVSEKVGGVVHWARAGTGDLHNVREDNLIFRSGDPTDGRIDYSRSFSAGSFHYYCEVHGSASGGMDGVVKVKPKVSAAPEGNPFTVAWANDGTNTGSAFDVQFKVGSGDWRSWKTNTSSASGVFGNNGNPVRVDAGTKYSFRARSQKTDGDESGWSPAKSFTP